MVDTKRREASSSEYFFMLSNIPMDDPQFEKLKERILGDVNHEKRATEGDGPSPAQAQVNEEIENDRPTPEDPVVAKQPSPEVVEPVDTLPNKVRKVEHRLPGFEHRLRGVFKDLVASAEVGEGDLLLYEKLHGVWLGEMEEGDDHDFQEDLLELVEEEGVPEELETVWRSFLKIALKREHRLWRSFKDHADRDGTDQLTASELEQFCRDLGLEVSHREVECMMKHADTTGGNTITYAEWYDLMHHYYIAPPTLATCVAHPLDSARIMLEELLQRTAEVVIDNGIDGFLIPELCAEDGQEVSAPKRKFLFSAFLATSITRTLTAPLDRLECLLQVPTHLGAIRDEQGRIRMTPRYSISAWQTLQSIVQREGFRSLWRGNGMNLTRVVPEVACRSWFYEHIKSIITICDDDVATPSDLPPQTRWIAGVSAAIASQMLLYPASVLKTQLQLIPKQEAAFGTRVWKLLQSDVRSAGIFSLYRGLCPSMIRVASDVAIYEYFKYLYHVHLHPHIEPHKQLPSIPILGGLAVTATAMASIPSYPLLLLRTRLQATSVAKPHLDYLLAPKAGWGGIYQTQGVWAITKSVLSNEGWRGMYRGYAVHLLKTVPTTALTMAGYEIAKRQFGIKTCY